MRIVQVQITEHEAELTGDARPRFFESGIL